jgi:hypothetical protein
MMLGRRIVTTAVAGVALTALLLPAGGSAGAAPGAGAARAGAVAGAAVAQGGPAARSAPHPLVECNYQVIASNVRFRINPNSSNAWGLLQNGDIVSGTPGDTATSGGNTFQHAFSGKFNQRGWVATQFIRRLTPCFE